ncbi:MAG: CBS domain-containing protein [Candidatus Eremiobacteraeota bacterium]|nr:CBS domain-containing protein [Candidatus Eremiobacteraeota bacterium]MCW5870146.1 CBS domain-containing protein [Candidatus Eremiobacteraeota bacterium]
MNVGEIMHKGVMTVQRSTSLQEVSSFFIEHGITGSPVVDDEGVPVGVISMSDLTAHAAGLDKPKDSGYLRHLWHDDPPQLADLTFAGDVTAGDVMTEFLIRVDARAEVRELLELMKSARLHRVFVTDQDKLVGIVTTLDLVMLLDRLLAEKSVKK